MALSGFMIKKVHVRSAFPVKQAPLFATVSSLKHLKNILKIISVTIRNSF